VFALRPPRGSPPRARRVSPRCRLGPRPRPSLRRPEPPILSAPSTRFKSQATSETDGNRQLLTFSGLQAEWGLVRGRARSGVAGRSRLLQETSAPRRFLAGGGSAPDPTGRQPIVRRPSPDRADEVWGLRWGNGLTPGRVRASSRCRRRGPQRPKGPAGASRGRDASGAAAGRSPALAEGDRPSSALRAPPPRWRDGGGRRRRIGVRRGPGGQRSPSPRTAGRGTGRGGFRGACAGQP
jgi:hypothetical protein